MQCKTMRKAESRSGMGMLLVLFPQDRDKDKDKDRDKFTFPSSNTLRSKAQSTISICAILLFTTLLLFTITTLPTAPPTRPIPIPIPIPAHQPPPSPHALQRMGILHRRGTKSMSDLTICHVPQDTPLHHFRLFLRLLHRSSLPASSDVVFLFPSPSQALKFSPIIRQENHAFNSLLNLHAHLNSTRWRQSPKSSFNPHRFQPHPQAHPQAQPQPIWGAKTPPPTNSSFTYGSILSFHAAELDPENSLAGFLPVLPLSLRRWACYPMLLSRLRRHFKHLMLVDVTTLLILKDPLPRVRTRGPDHVLLFRDHHAKRLLPSILMGGARGLRRLSAALLLEIVRAATHHRKRKNNNNAILVSESAVLTQLALGAPTQFLLKSRNVDLILSAESIPELAVPAAASSDSAMLLRRANNHHLDYLIMAQICSSLLDSSVYTDCQRLIS